MGGSFWAVFWLVVVVQAFICAALSSFLASEKGYGGGAWAAIGFFLGVLGLVAAAGLPPLPEQAFLSNESLAAAEAPSETRVLDDGRGIVRVGHLSAPVRVGVIDAALATTEGISFGTFAEAQTLASPQEPDLQEPPREPLQEVVPREPRRRRGEFEPIADWRDLVSRKCWREKQREADTRFESAHRKWAEIANAIREENRARLEAWESECARVEEENRRSRSRFEDQLLKWRDRRATDYSAFIEETRRGSRSALRQYAEQLLCTVALPRIPAKGIAASFDEFSHTLFIRRQLPASTEVSSMHRSPGRGMVIREYEALLCEAALASIYLQFRWIPFPEVENVSFTGTATFLDLRTGHETERIIMRLRVGQARFLAVNLSQVDPAQCFRHLGGEPEMNLHKLHALEEHTT